MRINNKLINLVNRKSNPRQDFYEPCRGLEGYHEKDAQSGIIRHLCAMELAVFILRTLRGGLRNMEEMSLQYAFQHIKNELQLIFVSAVRCPFCYVSFFMLKALGIDLEDTLILTFVPFFFIADTNSLLTSVYGEAEFMCLLQVFTAPNLRPL